MKPHNFKNETQFNAQLRKYLRARGFSVIHIKEADETGVFDLLVYKGSRILAWIELKMKDNVVEVSQREFMREEKAKGIPCMIIRWFPADPKGYNEHICIHKDPDSVGFRLQGWELTSAADWYYYMGALDR